MRLQETKERFHITVPKEYVRLLGWKKGQELSLYPLGEKEIIIKEISKKEVI
ncbi:MAG: AbrB/MazE/SpoVT family DNA-binding domain-containing protein [Sphaerochaetaceae bacterium]|nr:AbrB/MazE/SpoVT family DNA-binding domain-containing protein [Sphaerochaetaceae bacterium]